VSGRPVGAAREPHVVIDFDVTGFFSGDSAAGDPQVTVHSLAQDTEPQDTEPQDTEPQDTERPAPDRPQSLAQVPAPRPTADASAAALDPQAVRAEVAQRMAAAALVRDEADVAPEPEIERPALSAADLEAIRWRLDGGTLREVVDDRDALRELGERLDGPLADEVDNVAKAGLLSVRAEVYRLLGELGMAAAASRLALAHAESAGDVQSVVIAQAELAHVLRLRRDFKEADRLFAKAVTAAVPETLRSVVHENAGRSCFDQGRHMEALDHFARAVRLGRAEDTDLAERVGVCLQAVYIHVLRDGWGPYPRTANDILGRDGAAKPAPTAQPAPVSPAPGDAPGRPAEAAAFEAFDEPTAEQPIVRRG
jgi:tetratricopeptide (TPR) repeat protein